jgi:hypothetical protein
MPRCCAIVRDPANSSVHVYVEVNHHDEAAGRRAAQEAARTAAAKVRPHDQDPKVDTFTKDGELTQEQIDKI